ncbi:hypothetical protein D3C75_758180 [compost metagenome]
MPEATNPMSKKWFRIYVIVMTSAIAILLVLLFAWEPASKHNETAEAAGILAAMVNVTRGSYAYGFVDVKPGKSLTRTFHMALESICHHRGRA